MKLTLAGNSGFDGHMRAVRRRLVRAGALVCLACSVAASAQPSFPQPGDPSGAERIRKNVEQFVFQRLAGQPGRVSVEVGAIDPQLQLGACQRLEAFLPAGGRLWGNSTVGVRCVAGASWSLYVPVTVKIQAPVVVAARPLANGKTLVVEDLGLQTQDLTQLPPGVLTDPALAVGQTLSVGLLPGYPVRQDMLRAPVVIRQGQAVRLVARGGGFSVSAEGRALGNAVAGQTVQVRTSNGQTVSGVARSDGSVEVGF